MHAPGVDAPITSGDVFVKQTRPAGTRPSLGSSRSTRQGRQVSLEGSRLVTRAQALPATAWWTVQHRRGLLGNGGGVSRPEVQPRPCCAMRRTVMPTGQRPASTRTAIALMTAWLDSPAGPPDLMVDCLISHLDGQSSRDSLFSGGRVDHGVHVPRRLALGHAGRCDRHPGARDGAQPGLGVRPACGVAPCCDHPRRCPDPELPGIVVPDPGVATYASGEMCAGA